MPDEMPDKNAAFAFAEAPAFATLPPSLDLWRDEQNAKPGWTTDVVDKVDRLDSHTADAGRRSPSTHGKGLRGLDAQLVRAEGMLKNRGKSVNSQNRHLHDTCTAA